MCHREVLSVNIAALLPESTEENYCEDEDSEGENEILSPNDSI
jgi:hypothetical protein